MKKTAALISALASYLAVLCLLQLSPNLFPNEDLSSLSYSFRCVSISLLACLITGLSVFFIQNYRLSIQPYIIKLKKYQPLLYQLVRRDFVAKYKRSILGVLWSVLNPLLTMTVMTLVFSYMFRLDIENFPVYVMTGQVIYTLFNESTMMAMNSVLGNASLIKKVFVPKYIFPLSKAFSALTNLLFSLIALVIVMVGTGMEFHVTILLMWLPIIYVFIFSLGIGLVLSAALVFFRDINYLYSLFTFTLAYFTPIFYPISTIPEQYRWVIFFNPLYHYVNIFRDLVLYGTIPNVWQHVICILMALISLLIGLYLFYRKQDDFILYI